MRSLSSEKPQTDCKQCEAEFELREACFVSSLVHAHLQARPKHKSQVKLEKLKCMEGERLLRGLQLCLEMF